MARLSFLFSAGIEFSHLENLQTIDLAPTVVAKWYASASNLKIASILSFDMLQSIFSKNYEHLKNLWQTNMYCEQYVILIPTYVCHSSMLYYFLPMYAIEYDCAPSTKGLFQFTYFVLEKRCCSSDLFSWASLVHWKTRGSKPTQGNSVCNFYTVAFEFLTTLVKKLLHISKLDIHVKDDMQFILIDTVSAKHR